MFCMFCNKPAIRGEKTLGPLGHVSYPEQDFVKVTGKDSSNGCYLKVEYGGDLSFEDWNERKVECRM